MTWARIQTLYDDDYTIIKTDSRTRTQIIKVTNRAEIIEKGAVKKSKKKRDRRPSREGRFVQKKRIIRRGMGIISRSRRNARRVED
jgi:hypothetical protein